MALATLSIDLVAKLANLEAGFNKAQQLATKNAAQIEGAFSKAGAVLKGLGTSLIAGFAGFSLIGFIKETNEGVAALVDLKVATGASVENLSALEDIARRSGSSLDAVQSVLIKFNKALHETQGKEFSEVSEIIKQLGLNVAELRKEDPAEALRKVAVAFDQFADNGTKARQFQVLFGKGLKDMAQFFDDLSKSTKLNATVTGEAAAEAKKFSDELASLGKNTTDSARSIVGPLISALNDFIIKLRESAAESRKFWSELRKQDEAKFNAEAAKGRADAIAAITKLLNEGNLSLERRLRLENQLAQLQKANAPPREPSPFAVNPVPSKPSLKEVDTSATKAVREHANEIDVLIAKLGEEAFALEHVGDVNEELHKAQLALATDPRLADAPIELRVLYEALAQSIDSLHRKAKEVDPALAAALQHDALLGDALAELRKDTDAQAAAFERLKQATPTEQMKQMGDALAEIQRQFSAGLLTSTQAAEMSNLLLGVMPRDFVAEWKAATDEVKGAFEDVLGNNILTLFHGTTKGILDSWANLLQQMVAKALAAKIGEAIFGNVDASSWLGLAVKFFTGTETLPEGSIGQAPISTDSVGSRMKASSAPSHMLGTQGGSTTVNINIASGVSRNELAAMVPALTEHVKASVMTTMRRPGFRGA